MATMACSLEARSPLLDHELAGYVARLRPALKIRRSHPKYLLRSAYADVLPPAVAWGPKRGFEVPIERWVGEDFRQLIGDTLGSSQARVTQFLERRALDQVLAGTTLAKRNWAQLIYALLVLELWLRQPPGAA